MVNATDIRAHSQKVSARLRGHWQGNFWMNKLLVAAAISLAFAAPASAQVFDSVGDCISDGLYGNEPNMRDGSPGGPSEQAPGTKGRNVVATQSPGPFVNNPADPDNPTRGRSVGQLRQDGINAPEICRAISG